jgi:hypothetical protein
MNFLLTTESSVEEISHYSVQFIQECIDVRSTSTYQEDDDVY